MSKALRFVLISVFSFISFILAMVALSPMGIFLKLVQNPEFPQLARLDFSAIWAYQTMMLMPVGRVVVVVTFFWSVVLWLVRMPRWMWVFILFFVVNVIVTFTGLLIATSFVVKKHIEVQQQQSSPENIKKIKTEAREKLKKITELDLYEQQRILSVLNSPWDESLIPEWEALGKRIVDYVPKSNFDSLRDHQLGEVVEALSKYPNRKKSMEALNEIEKQLNLSSVKSRDLFSKFYYQKKQFANPAYQIINNETATMQLDYKRMYLEAEQKLNRVYAAGLMVSEGRDLLKRGDPRAALKKFKDALNDPYMRTKKDSWEARRSMVEAVIAANGKVSNEDLMQAIQLQKDFLKNGIGGQAVHLEIQKLWKLYDYYLSQQVKGVSFNPAIVERAFKIDTDAKRKEYEDKYAKQEDKSSMLWSLGAFYFSNIQFEKAELVFLDGLEYVKDRKAAGKSVGKNGGMDSYMFYDLLKNLYVIQGQYDKAISIIQKMKEDSQNRPINYEFSRQRQAILKEQYDHFIEALNYAKSHNISPLALNFSHGFDSFIEFDAPDWVTWKQKYPAIWAKVKNL